MALSERYTYSEHPLVVGTYQTVNEPEMVASGQGILPAGAILGRITASGEWVLSMAGASDGSQIPRGVLGVELDATTSAVIGPVFKAGVFNPNALIFGTGHTEASVKSAWEGMPLFVRRPLNDGSI